MILFILSGLTLIIGSLLSVILILYYSKKQDENLALWDEYEEKIGNAITALIGTLLVTIFMIVIGCTLCLSI